MTYGDCEQLSLEQR